MMPEEPARDFMRRSLFNLRYLELSADPDGQRTLLEGNDQELRSVIPDRMRTIGNHRGLPTFEFTALVNSFLMTFIHPWETYFDRALDNWSYVEAMAAWEFPELLLRRDHTPLKDVTISRVIRVVRNALAHGNFRLSPSEGYIWRVELWNVDPRISQPIERDFTRTWLSQDVMRQFLFAFARMTEEIMAGQEAAAWARVETATRDEAATG